MFQSDTQITSTNAVTVLVSEFKNVIFQQASNIEVNTMARGFRPGEYLAYDMKQMWGREGGGRMAQMRYTVPNDSPNYGIVTKATVEEQFTNYLNECLQQYSIVGNIITYKCLLWLVGCSLLFLLTKLKGLTSEILQSSVVAYDSSATVVIPSINNENEIENIYYDALSNDPLINCFNDELKDTLHDLMVQNYSSEENIKDLVANLTDNLKNVINTTTVKYNTSVTCSSSCSSSSSSSSSMFLAHLAG
jgi:hypothetical protein